MENYKLQETEVVLYKGDVKLANEEGNTKLYLTNINLVFITKSNVSIDEPIVNVYPVDNIKIYEGHPQVKAKGNDVEIFLLSNEIEFSFLSKAELNKFMSSTINLITGKTKAERCVQNVKNAIDLVDNTFGINTISMVGNAIKNNTINKVLGIKNIFNKKK